MLRGLNCFREVIGQDPRLHANHTGQVESIYWGRARLDGVPKVIYQWAWRLTKGEDQFHGHSEGGPYFWGDLCRDRIMYVRNLVFREINTLKVDPLMPYHDPRRPYVRYWFSSSEAPVSIPSASSSQRRTRIACWRKGGPASPTRTSATASGGTAAWIQNSPV